ncbi:hypothetical protein PEXP_073010 [Penicillium expansum]|nr:hypothetical protein PEXP_073010 [Penicillium expansum]
MSFGWSAGDLVSAIQLLGKVAASLKEIDGSREHYQQDSAYLLSLANSLQYLKDHDSALPSASQGLDTLKSSIEHFGNRLNARFGDSLGKNKKHKRRFFERLRSAPRSVQYGLFVSDEVDELRRRVDIPLKNLIIGIGIDNNNLINQSNQNGLQTRLLVNDLAVSVSTLSVNASESYQQKMPTMTNWLKPLLLEDIHSRLLAELVHGSCKWLFDRDEFIGWKSAGMIHDRYPMLWVMGKAGAGKTHLAARAIEELKSVRPLAYFYCDAKDESRRSVLGILSNWNWQLLQQDPSLLDDVILIKKKRELASQAVLEDILVTIVQKVSDAVLVIDGFDECEAQEQVKLYSVLARLSKNARILVFRRNVFNLPSRLLVPAQCVISYEISEGDNIADINQYIKERVTHLEIDADDIREDIKAALRSGAKGMFLWVALMVEELRKPLFSDSDYLKTLRYLPEDLNLLYIRILRGLPSRPQESRISKGLLQLITCAQRPLSLHEISAAMMASLAGDKLEPSITSEEGLRTIISHYCGPLVMIHKGLQSCPTATLVHSSLKEFLLESQAEDIPVPLRIDAEHSHMALAQICLTYLSYDNIEVAPFVPLDERIADSYGSISLDNRMTRSRSGMRANMDGRFAAFIRRYSLLEYSSLHWCFHLKRSLRTSETYEILLRLCQSKNKTIRWLQVAHYLWRRHSLSKVNSGVGILESLESLEEIAAVKETLLAGETGFSSWLRCFHRYDQNKLNSNLTKRHKFFFNEFTNDFLPEIHVAALFDFPEWVEEYLLDGVDVDQKSHMKQTPLILASAGDSFNSMRILLRHGADINATDFFDKTALDWIAQVEDWSTLYRVPYTAGQILLNAGARISRDSSSNILARVCCNSSTKDPFLIPFVSSLLANGADAVIENYYRELPAIHWAAISGNAALVKLLLEHGSRPDLIPWGSRGKETPLLHICSMPYVVLEVVEVLLGAGASVSARRSDGRSALHLASNHPLQLAYMLLQAGADVNARSMDGCTPLNDADIAENVEVVELLLKHKVMLDAENNDSLTPLALANTNRGFGAAQMLQAAYDQTGAPEFVNTTDSSAWMVISLCGASLLALCN